MQNWPTSPYIYPTPASPAEPVAASQARKLCAHPVATATTKQASARHMDCATEHVWSDDAAFSAYLYSPQHENTPRSDGCPCCWHLHLRPLEDCKLVSTWRLGWPPLASTRNGPGGVVSLDLGTAGGVWSSAAIARGAYARQPRRHDRAIRFRLAPQTSKRLFDRTMSGRIMTRAAQPARLPIRETARYEMSVGYSRNSTLSKPVPCTGRVVRLY